MNRRQKRTLARAGIGAATIALAMAARAACTPKRDATGKVVAVVGASRGLGLAVARKFADEGAKIAICGRDPERLERAVDDLASNGATVFGLDCDARDPDDVERFFSAVDSRLGAVDVLVYVAGVIEVGPLADMTDDDFSEAMDTHFWGAYNCVRAVVPAMRERGSGSIVNVASIGGLVSVPHLVPYCASKFALVGYSTGLRQELAADGISVTTICPGLMRTGSTHNAFFKGRNVLEHAWFTLAGTNPLTSISAATAASQIFGAWQRRENIVVLSPQAKLLATMAHYVPNVVTAINALVARTLPPEGGIETRRATGGQSPSAITGSIATELGKRAEVDLNQL
jgi:NAD(P)-dependent dehydrogenase (short-subunit alcohol dehydrogenase family)